MAAEFVVFARSEIFTVPDGVDLRSVRAYMAGPSGEFVELRPFVSEGGTLIAHASGTMHVQIDGSGAAILEWDAPATQHANTG